MFNIKWIVLKNSAIFTASFDNYEDKLEFIGKNLTKDILLGKIIRID